MSDDLKLVARIEDQFTGPLSRLRRGLHDVSVDTKQQVGAWRKDWDGARESVARFDGVLRGVTPVLSGLGVAGVGVGLSIGAAASALGEFSSKTRNLSQIGKDLGFTVDQLRTFQGLGERFGVSADTMTGALRNMSTQMFEINKQGTTFVELQAMNLGKLAGVLAKETNPQKFLEKAMEGIRDIPNNEIKRRVARLIFGTDDISIIVQNINGPIKDAFREVSASIGSMSKETEQAAKDFQKNMNHISEAAERAKLKFIGPLLESMVGVIDYAEKHGIFGQDKNRPATQSPGDLDESLDAQMRGQRPLSKAEKERQNRADAIARELSQKSGELDYARKRIVREPEAERRLSAEIQRLTEELRRLCEQGATLSPSSFGGPAGGGSLIHKAAWGGLGFGGGGPLGGSAGSSMSAYGSGPRPSGPIGGSSSSPGTAGQGPAGTTGPLTGSENGAGSKGQFTAAPSEAAGTYRPERKLTDRDLSDAVVNTIAGEARLRSQGGADAVINNMFNRLGSKGWGPSRDLQDVARAPGQYEGYRTATAAEATFIRDRIRAIASGGVPDNTNGANSFRASWYRGPWWRRFGQYGKDVAGNTFAYDPSIPNGPYAPYASPKAGAGQGSTVADQGDAPWHQRPRSNEPGKMSRLRDDELEVAGSGERPGDAMMRRFYGQGGQMGTGKGSLHIKLEGAPQGTKVKASMDDLFQKTTVEQGRSQMDMA